MADQLTDLFRERLAGHEMDAPADAWDHISGQLATGGGEGLRETLQEKFQGHEVGVDPSAWVQISGQLGHAGTAGGTIGAGWIAAGVAAVALTAGVFLWQRGTETEKVAPATPRIELAQEQPVEAPLPASEEAAMPATEVQEPRQAEVPVLPAKEVNTTGQVEPQGSENKEVESATDAESKGATTSPASTTDKTSAQQPEELAAPPAGPAGTTGNGGSSVPENKEDRAPAKEEKPVAAPGPEGERDKEPRMVDPFSETTVQKRIFIPNVFTPQGDGINDVLEVVVSDFESVDVKVVSTKTGAMVFHTNDLNEQWDGRLPNGNNAEEGHYQCIVRVNFNDGRSKTTTELVRLYR